MSTAAGQKYCTYLPLRLPGLEVVFEGDAARPMYFPIRRHCPKKGVCDDHGVVSIR